MSPFWVISALRMMEVMMTTGAIRHAKLQSNHHRQRTNNQLLTDRMPFLTSSQHLRVNLVKKKKKKYFIRQITDNTEQLKYITTFGGLPVKHTPI